VPQAIAVRSSVVERFLRYVTYDTTSDHDSTTVPTTAKQLVLLDLLVEELKALGCADASRDAFGIVMATLPATTSRRDVPVIGFLAHVDTSSDVSGTGVKPIVHERWDGGDIVLPDDPSMVLRPSETPALAGKAGEDIITASGKTLLGADDKAGIAAIMAAVEHLVKHPEIPHGTIRIGFTPDEEVGTGIRHFDVARFGARYAYTMDSSDLGKIETETFSADAMTVTFQGFSAHPGFAKGKMVNAIKVASDFVARLPKDRLSPETTEGAEGFFHPVGVDGAAERAVVRFIVRDFVTPGLAEKEAFLTQLARDTAAAWGATASVEVTESYRNMREVLDRHPEVVANAREAIRRAGVEPITSSIRGGTDGSRLSFMGLPTPNLFTGMQNFHSRLEWVSARDMEKAVETIVQLCRIWEERASG
jgi:tripeptide aminopeptidase